MNSTTLANLATRIGTATDPIPLYRLNTVLGSAYNLATAGTGSDEISVSTTVTIDCGALIRLSDPLTGPIMRVRGKCDNLHNCDCVSPSASGSLQLASVDDLTVPVSLTLDSLAFATREIQTIKFFLTTGDLNQGVGGFRLSFGTEITSTTIRGGNGGPNFNDDIGCILWSSGSSSSAGQTDALALEAELESLDSIDDVTVFRTLSINPTIITYKVIFVGVKVRGKLPALTVTDVGINGCSAFSSTPQYVVTKEQLAYATMYQADTTQAIPFDGSEQDVKVALEQLTSVANVDVTRVINHNGYDWMVTYTQDKNSAGFAHLYGNGLKLAAVRDPRVRVTAFNQIDFAAGPVLGAGVPLFARVSAHNAVGYGDVSASVPTSIQLSKKLPEQPLMARVDVLSTSQLLVQWDYPLHDGGEEVTEYKVEWWSATINAGAKQSATVRHTDTSAIEDVNMISVSAPTFGTYTFLSGTFRVGFDGQWTPELVYDISAVDMETTLKQLPTVEDLTVKRTLTPNGFTWIITFHSRKYAGNQQIPHFSSLQHGVSHKLDVSGTNLLMCTTTVRDTCVLTMANSMSPSVVTANSPEIQQIVCTGTPSATETFKLSYMGATTASIPSNVGASGLESALEAMGTIGDVSVSFLNPAQTTLCATNPQAVYITFVSELGDVNILVGSAATGGFGTYAITEFRKGRTQYTVGRLPYSYVISGVTVPNADVYNVRVSAYNSIGYGPPVTALPISGVIPSTRSPSVPLTLTVTTLSRSSLLLLWENPVSDGGSPITNYRVEWDAIQSFTGTCGEKIEVQHITLSAAALPAAGVKYKLMMGASTVVGCLDWQATVATVQTQIRALGGYYAAALVTQYGDNTARWDYGHTYVVQLVNTVASGVVPPSGFNKFWVDATDATCNSYTGTVSVTRQKYGPGLDDKLAKGKIDLAANNVDIANNECHAQNLEGIAQVTITTAAALQTALQATSLQVMLGSTQLNQKNSLVLCDNCVQGLTGSTLTVTSSMTGIVNVNDYFVVEASDDPTLPPKRCVCKATAVGATTITIDATDAAYVNGCQLTVPFNSKTWRLKTFNVVGYLVDDLTPGLDYSTRVVAINAQGESPAMQS